MHTGAIRLGIEWARVFPTAASFPDHPDEAAVQHYLDMLRAARSRGLAVMVTLQHDSLPLWVHDPEDAQRRGWEDPAIVGRFAAWAGFCAQRFGSLVDLWLTINEPVPALFAGWVGAVFPPGKAFAVSDGMAALGNMLAAHARAYDAIHEHDTADADGDGKPALVSYAHHMALMMPLDAAQPGDQQAAATLDRLWNRYALDAVTRGDIDADVDGRLDGPRDQRGVASLMGRLDFIGLNFYGPAVVIPLGQGAFPVVGAPSQNDVERWGVELPKSDFGWAISAAGLGQVLAALHPYGLPIYITENGVADGSDALRPRYLIEHLRALAQAIAAGADVRGYFHWSLMDNFEWASGYCPRFGLLRVEPGSPGRLRVAGEGARVYREIIDAGGVTDELAGRYPAYPPASPCPRVGF